MIRRFALGCLALLPSMAAADTLKVTVPNKGTWNMVEFAVQQGFFKKSGLDVELAYTAGGSQTMQALISGSVDVATNTGILAIVGAFSKGAPLRVIAAGLTGTTYTFWFAKADSPIRGVKDMAGKVVGFSEAGSTSDLILREMLRNAGLSGQVKLVAVGAAPAGLTQVMSGQVDASWSVVPFGLQQVKDGAIRIVARSGDVSTLQQQAINVTVTTASVVAAKHAALGIFNKVIAQTIDWAYTDPKAMELLAEGSHVSLDIARESVEQFIPKPVMQPFEIRGVPQILQQAADFKFTNKLLTEPEVAPLFSAMNIQE